ncbi:MAG: TIGR00282 family metallophosphoesterase [Spirochaetales bacterium]|uniref:TIGR00282 family metallophosphoesterase n=1 Tax=Candidatus Thalassospirochaeta sargassi TaxID=3119039 RepID=A0AAJ1MLQ0_9SPIO|nr:TIGR00282 family metallophosphoesterase [Spirochaetales bacterium]
MADTIKALLLGDIIGQPGCRAVFIGLKKLIKNYKADVVMINGENAADGFGISPENVQMFFSSGADVITTGNHVWQKKEIYPLLGSRAELLRPANYPKKAPGHGSCVVDIKGTRIGFLNLQGRVDLPNIDCPFVVGKEEVRKLRKETKIIIVDFHAENVEEKEALGLYLDGQVSSVTGTHTHIQTGDERILTNGTAYMTDIGMTGPMGGVIGSKSEIAVQRQQTQMPLKMEIEDLPATLNGVLITINKTTGKATGIERISEKSL